MASSLTLCLHPVSSNMPLVHDVVPLLDVFARTAFVLVALVSVLNTLSSL